MWPVLNRQALAPMGDFAPHVMQKTEHMTILRTGEVLGDWQLLLQDNYTPFNHSLSDSAINLHQCDLITLNYLASSPGFR